MTLEINKKIATALRILSVDMVERAKSGHPGMPLGMADIALVLWRFFLKYNPKNPNWFNRDRFVMSNGHGSALYYALLHLSGYKLSIEDLKSFRSIGSITPGHPEINLTPGIEINTGPLGQGLGGGVGMALAEKIMASKFNKECCKIIDHYTYVFVGDGCLMEGLSHEVCSLAGIWNLNKLIVIWDNNGISIDGAVGDWFCENVEARFKAYAWNVIANVNGHDANEVYSAIEKAKNKVNGPTLICCKTKIGYGTNVENSNKAHGAALGELEIKQLREKFNWDYDPFFIPHDVYDAFDFSAQGDVLESDWNKIYEQYKEKYPELYSELNKYINFSLPDNWTDLIKDFFLKIQNNCLNISTRQASQNCISFFLKYFPNLLGGSADLTGSNLTACDLSSFLSKDNYKGNYIYYGVREFGMVAIMNGIACHGGFIPYGGTFLVFSDYARSAIRLSAMMHKKVIFIFTHDSIFLGEDGPTHQPIEHLASLRLIPNLDLWRPCDETETMLAWAKAIENDCPTVLALSRQNLKKQTHDVKDIKNIGNGGYIIYQSGDTKDLKLIIIATGSEVELGIEVAKFLWEKNKICVRVVSIPSVYCFEKNSIEYKDYVLNPNNLIKSKCKKVVIEAGKCDAWYKYIDSSDIVIDINEFGESGTQSQLRERFKLNISDCIEKIGNI